jgi:predicted dehydrogenase
MSRPLNVGIIGAGWPGGAHARGYVAAGGFKIAAVADLIPERREKLAAEFQVTKTYATAEELLKDSSIEAVSMCLPTPLHGEIATRALRAGKHVVCETPPAATLRGAKQLHSAAAKYTRVLMYAFQRRFGGAEMSARQAIEKGYVGEVFHARAAWMRTRGIPVGTGWYTEKGKSGGGAMIDLGLHMLDTAWYLMGSPRPETVFAVTHQKSPGPAGVVYDVEDVAVATIKFEGNKTLELATSWSINQPPSQNGTALRVSGTMGAIDVYTAKGAVLYRPANSKGDMKETPLAPPKLTHHAAMMRNFKSAIAGAVPQAGGAAGVTLMKMIEAIYKSAETGRSVDVREDKSEPKEDAAAVSTV